MLFNPSTSAVTLALWLVLPASAESLYPKSSSVIQVTAKTYDRLIARSNQSAILEFYAPWCGHCQNLKPAYEKAAKSVENLSAKVAAINCDDDENKSFCGSMGVKGFPTLKTIKPGKKPGKPIVSDYNGERSAKAIADTLIDTIPNHVVKVTDETLKKFLKDWEHMPKAILFTDKAPTSPLLKSLAIDFKDVIKVAQIHKKQQAAIEKFEVKKFPTLMLLPGPDDKGEIFLGEMKNKNELTEFLTQAAPPNPEPAAITPPKKPAKKDEKKPKKEDKKPKKEESSGQKIIKEENETPNHLTEAAESPKASIRQIPNMSYEELKEKCLTGSSGTCVLAFVHEERTPVATSVLQSLAEINGHFLKSKTKIFPFYSTQLPLDDATRTDGLKGIIGMVGEVNLVAVNRKRGWYREYKGDPKMEKESIEKWIDEIRFGEKEEEKKKFPDENSSIGTEKTEKYDPTAPKVPLDEVEAGRDLEAEINAAESAYVEDSGTPQADPVEEPVVLPQQAPVPETGEPVAVPETPAPESKPETKAESEHDEL